MLEDCHWIDELSRDLLEALVRSATSLPVLFVLAYRPANEPGGGLGIEGTEGFSELLLDRMEPDDVAELVRSKMQQLLGGEGETEVSDALVDLVAARSEGNPFYVEELISFIVSQGIDAGDPAEIETIRLPDSLHTLVLSRIDAAAEGPRRTMKVASVVGRVFEAPMLPGAYRELGDLAAVIGHLDALRTLDLVALDREADQAWMFKHVVTQEVAYESLPFALRIVLHGLVGDYIERTESADLDRVVPLLEHHYWRSDREDKKREYLQLAAEAAQASYANNAAIAYYERLVSLLEGLDKARALLALGNANELAGDWNRASVHDNEALELAIAIGDRREEANALASLAEVARKQGHYDEATNRIDAAKALYSALDDDVGIGVVSHLSGTVAAQQGRYEDARECYLESFSIRERHGDKDQLGRLLSNLAIVAEYSSDFVESRRLNEEALAVRTSIGDRWAIALSLNNLGVIDLYEQHFQDASDRYEESVRLAREVGDPWLLSLAYFNLGKARKGLGDEARAREIFGESIRAFQRLEDPYDLAEVIEDIAVIAAGEPACRRPGAARRRRPDAGRHRGGEAGRARVRAVRRPRAARACRSAPPPRTPRSVGAQRTAEETVALALEVCAVR